ncbi:MAG: hypothetical protein ACRDRZ_16240 [Pseudonocardiaceae bacterium]
MSADADRERRRRELTAAAEELFEALYPEDLAALMAKYGVHSALCDAVVDCAGKVADRVARIADPVRPDEYALLSAACLTWGNEAGVARNPGHAAKKFLRYHRFAQTFGRHQPTTQPPLGILIRADRMYPDDEQLIGLLADSLPVRAGVIDARAAGEPELILNAVIPAIVAALRPGSDGVGSLVGIALAVLERGAGLATHYRVARRPVPVGGTDLPVAGNTDFLVRIAAYRLAVEERLGKVVTLDGLQEAVAHLAGVLRKAMTRSAGRFGWHGPDEPDVATAINQYASYLGSAAEGATLQRAVRRVHSVLSYGLDLDDPPREKPVDDLDGRLAPTPDGAEPADVEHLVGWLVFALFDGACKETREGLLKWLTGTMPADCPKYLPWLVRRLRVATRVLDKTPDTRSPRPDEVPPSQLDAVHARLVAAVDPGQIRGCTRDDARLVALDALPPLWTRRRAAILQVASHLRPLIGPRKALLVATHGVRAPVQYVQPSSKPPPVPCCPDGLVAPGAGRPREPVPAQAICPHRPWGETGWVENYRTVGDAAGYTPEAARRQLERYQGPWPELLWY